MGGYGSTRWNYSPTRQSTAGLLKLDVRSLKRGGALQPAAVSTVSWGEGQWVVASMDSRGERLTLEYRTRGRGDAEWTRRTLRIWLEWTPCHYGGERVWFRCPHCQRRRAVLYSAGGGVFGCTGCHDLAYSSTRQDAIDRGTNRLRALQRKLQAPPGCVPWHVPDKPPRMHWRTYRRLVWELRIANACRDAVLGAQFEGLMQRSAALLPLPEHENYLSGGRAYPSVGGTPMPFKADEDEGKEIMHDVS